MMMITRLTKQKMKPKTMIVSMIVTGLLLILLHGGGGYGIVVVHSIPRNSVLPVSASSTSRRGTARSVSSSSSSFAITAASAAVSTSSSSTITTNNINNNSNSNNNNPQLYYANRTNHIQQTLTYLQWFTFIIMMSSSMVALVPVQATLQLFHNDQGRTTQYLSILTTSAAVLELTCSPRMGTLLDRYGRKCILLIIIGVVLVLHTTTAIMQPMNGVTIALQKCVGTIAIGFFMMTVQTIMTDLVLLSSVPVPVSSSVSSSTTTLSVSSSNHHHNNHINHNNPLNLSSVMAQQMAVTGIGFLFGIVTAGVLSKYMTHHPPHYYNVIIYSIAALWTVLAYILVQFQLHETHDVTSQYRNVVAVDGPQQPSSSSSSSSWQNLQNNIQTFVMTLCHSLLSCTNLLTKYGIKIRILSILLLIMTLPMYMGDLFQIYAKTEWNLSTSMFSSYLSLFAITGIISNVVGSMLIKSMGIRTFTQVAILSKMIPSLFTILFGYRGSMIGIIIGFLGNAQSIGIIAALISQSTTMTASESHTKVHHQTQQSHTPSAHTSEPMKKSPPLSPSQGVMAGERAALMALLKVIGPILYSTLFIQGRNYFQTSNVPFIFNIMLSIIALLITSHYL